VSQTEALLEAGGLVPVKSKIAKDSTVDRISARVYRHPALGDRPVVRLTADGLAQGDDLAMEFLGFEAPEVDGPLALRRRQALGFPGWALINDPDHARYALELVKEFRKEARRAKSKPGHAYDSFVEIAKRLDRSVAHFLPSYWEEVGREFMQVGNSTYAARAFGKAREAEKVHSLKVVETLRQDAFLEFALAGSLSTKALTEYGKDLQRDHDPAEAWEFFRELCVRRTLGGMPPWASMMKELRQLIQSAGLDVENELERLLKEIIESPAMNRAAMGFWKTCSKTVKNLAAKDAHVAGVLLNLMPETSYWDHSSVWQWLDYLEEWGLLENAWQDDVPEAARPERGAAKWLQRYVEIDEGAPQRVVDLLTRMADRLRQDDEPLDLTCKRYPRIPVDLLDLALELKIPVADPAQHTRFDLSTWAVVGEDAVDRPRDPVHVHADPRFQKMLEEAVREAAGGERFEMVAHGKTALAEARKAWLLGEVSALDQFGLPKAAELLEQIEQRTSRTTFQEFPEAFDALRQVDLQSVLRRTLQTGLIDEYGWPALEGAVGHLDLKEAGDLRVFCDPPYVTVSDGLKMLVVGPSGIVFEHEVQAKKGQTLCDAFYLDGQLLVVLEFNGWQNVMYWSSQPKKQIELRYYHARNRNGFRVPLESGGTFSGNGTAHAGDQEPPTCSAFFHDGEHFWRTGWFNDEWSTRQIGLNGETGRKSLPAFLEDYITDGKVLNEDSCSLMSLGEWANESPLGAVEGCVGWRVRSRKPATENAPHYRFTPRFDVECEGIDGRTWNGGLGDSQNHVPDGLIDWPGTDQPLPFAQGTSYRQPGTELWDASGQFQVARLTATGLYNRGQVAALSPLFWHAFRVRDEKSSKKLRTISEKQTKTLLDAATADLEAADGDSTDQDIVDSLPELPAARAAIKKWLKDVKSERFLRGLEGIVFLAGKLTAQLKELVDGRDPDGEDVSDGSGSMQAHLEVVGRFFRGEYEAGPIAAPEFTWFPLAFNSPEAQLLRECWLNDGNVSDFSLNWLETRCDSGLADLPGSFRQYTVSFSGTPPVTLKARKDMTEARPPWHLFEHNGNRYVLWREYEWGDDVDVFEYAPTGQFKDLPGSTVEEAAVFHRSWSTEQCRLWADAFRQCDEPPWPDNEALQAAADQIGIPRSEVALIWCAKPNVDSYESKFLPKALRERLRLKVKEASTARQAVRELSPELTARLRGSLTSGTPEDLWEDNGQRALDRLVDVWCSAAPKRLDVPADVLDALSSVAGYGGGTEYVSALADPQKHTRLKTNATWKIELPDDGRRYYGNSLTAVADSPEAFDSTMLKVVTEAVPLLYITLPGGTEAAANVLTARKNAVKCLKKSGLLFDLGSRHFWGEDSSDRIATMLKSLLGKTKKQGKILIGEKGPLVGAATDNELALYFRPAKIKSVDDVQKLSQALAVLQGDGDRESYVVSRIDLLSSVELIRSDTFTAICGRMGEMEAGRHDANPLYSASDIVEQVVATHEIEEDAAVLYLQLLTLHAPTTANLKVWNEWTPARIKKAAAPLLKKELILEAKRARSGRNYFVPGGWEPLKAPHLPIETWKLPLYDVQRDAASGELQTPLSRILPLRPLGELFAAAWQRTQDGDAPAYEEVN
jgi:hypothetical protein